MALLKKEQIMTRIETIANSLVADNFTVERRIGDPDPSALTIAGFPYLFVKDDVEFVNALVNKHETSALLVGITCIYDSVDLSPTKLNNMLGELKEKVYTDSELGGLSDFIKFDQAFKNRTPETNYTMIQVQFTVTYEEKIY